MQPWYTVKRYCWFNLKKYVHTVYETSFKNIKNLTDPKLLNGSVHA